MVQTCYEQCLRDYQAYVPCGAEWIAIYDCLVGLECARRFYATCVSILRDSTGSRNAYCTRTMANGLVALGKHELWPMDVPGRAPRLSQGVNEAKLSSCRMADGDEIQRLMCSGQSEHPLHLVILERAYWNRSQIHCDGLQ